MYDRPVGGRDLLPGIAADDPIVERRPGSVLEPLPCFIPEWKEIKKRQNKIKNEAHRSKKRMPYQLFEE